MLQLSTNIKSMKNKKTVIILAILTLIVGGVIWFGYNFAPGSYPYAEEYEINVKESDLIKAIQDFKKDNPQYIVPEQTQLKDEQGGDRKLWYFVYFYYPQENQILCTWTRPIDKGKTTFAFIGINQGLELGNWKMINKDYGSSENKEEKKKFEERILNKIKEKL